MNTHYVLPALIVGALAACTSADEAIVADQEPVSAKADALVVEWGAQDELTLASALLDFAPARLPGALLPKPIGTLLAAWGGRPLEGCVHGSTWLDRDGDGIPARWRADLDCYVTRPDGLSIQIRGAVSVADSDDSLDMSGYEVTFRRVQIGTFLNHSPLMARTLDGTASVQANGPAKQRAARLGLEGDFNLVVQRWRPLEGSTASYQTRLRGAYTADVDVAFAAPLSRGALELDLATYFTRPGHEPIRVRAKTAPTLHYDAACRTDADALPFDDGTFIAESGRNFLRMAFADCGERTVAGVPLADETIQGSRAPVQQVPALAQPAPKPTHTGDPPDVPVPQGP